jgi:hypothetical protein
LNNRAQTAVLPERKFQVMPSTIVPQTPAPAQLPAAVEPVDIPEGAALPATPGGGTNYWTWLALLFGVLWLLTLALLFRRKRDDSSKQAVKSDEAPGERAILNKLKEACLANDAGRVRRELNYWLRAFGPPGSSGSVLEFAHQLEDQALSELLIQLDADGFRPDAGHSWEGASLWTAFSNWRSQWLASQKNRETPVMDLYARPA